MQFTFVARLRGVIRQDKETDAFVSYCPALNSAQMTPGRFFDLLREVNPASASPVTH